MLDVQGFAGSRALQRCIKLRLLAWQRTPKAAGRLFPSGALRRRSLIVHTMTRLPAAWRPPARDGVGASRLTVLPGPWATVAEYFTARLRPGIDWPSRMAQGEVLDAQGQPLAVDTRCVPGQSLWYWRHLPPEPRVPFEMTLLHADEHLAVVDKPHFLAAVPGGPYLQETVMVRLKRLLGNDDLVPLHRLDRETAGVLMFSTQPATRDAYHALLRERRVHKVYEAVAPWRADLLLPLLARHHLQNLPGARHLPVQLGSGEPNTQTRIELLRRLGRQGSAMQGPAESTPELAHYRLLPLTGHRHQLRVQLNALGLPIVGDRIYPRLWPEAAAGTPPDYTQPLQLLARELAFTDPLSGAARRFVSGRQLALAEGG